MERLKLIYNNDSNNIFIDEYVNAPFIFNGDKRNNIHLLLYFNIYKNRYDVVPGEIPIIIEAIERKIPIIFIVNKCGDEIFDDDEEKEDLIKEVKNYRENTLYEKYETYFINCIKKRGINELFDRILEEWNKYMISIDELSNIRNDSIKKLFKFIKY